MKLRTLIFSLNFILLCVFSNANDFIDKEEVEYRFTENKGQLVDFDQNVRDEFVFYSISENLDIYFREKGITYIFKKGDKIPNSIGLSKEDEIKVMKAFLDKQTLYYRMDIDFVNPKINMALRGDNNSEYYLNFYYPQCPDGIHNVKAFEKIIYSNVYDGIDFEFYFKDNQFKYDVILNANADINDIKIKFNGVKNISLSNNQLLILSPVGEIIETLPKSFFINENGDETNTDITYELNGDIVKFVSKDKINNKLIIDPQISWTTYYDDCFWNGSGSSIDKKGNQFVITSYGFSDDFPILDPGSSAYFQNSTAGSGDCRIVKFDNDGVRIWATYYGGTDYDHSPHVKIDYSGNILIACHTVSSDIPVQSAGGYYDASYTAGTFSGGTFILKFNSSGVRQWGTHYDYVHYPMLEVDNNNNLYVLGKSEYDNPPVLSLSGAYNQATVSLDAGGSNHSADIFIVKFNSATTRLWATNLGSTTDEFVQDMKCGSDNYLNILGISDCYSGTDLITKNPSGGAYFDNTTGPSATNRDDALIYRFNTSGFMVWGTAFGSSTANDNVQQGRITTDDSNNIYIYAETADAGLPFTNPLGGAYFDNTFSGSSFNPFIARFTSAGVLNWCTYFGSYGLGFGMNFSNYLGVSTDNKLIAVISDAGGVGGTHPLVPRAGDYNATLNVYSGVYIAEFASDLSLAWSTYYAGTTDRHTLGDCALSTNTCGYELYMTSNWEKYDGAATDPPWVKPIPSSYQDISWQTTGNKSGLISRFSNLPSTAPTSITAVPATLCSGGSTDLTVNGGSLGSGADWYWYEGGCGTGSSIGTGSTINVSPTTTTTYYVLADGDCNTTTCASVTVTVGTLSTAATSASASPSTVCSGTSSTLSITGGSLGTNASWEWYSGSCGGIPVGTGNTISVSPSSTTTYYVQATGDCNTTTCVSVIVTVGILSTDPTSATATNTTICEGSSTDLTVNGGSLGTNATWEWYSGSCGGISVGTGVSISINPTTTTTYYVMAEGDCNNTACTSVTINVIILNIDTIIITDVSCNGTNGSITVQISGGSGIYTYLWSNGDTTATITGLSAASYDLTVTDANGCDLVTSATVQNNGGGLITSMTNVIDVDCFGNNNGEATVSVGSGSYTYLWSNSDTTATITGLSGGYYYVTVEDLFGCQGIDTVYIQEPAQLTYSDSVTHVSCYGGNDGVIDLNISGGTPGYTYNWLPSGFTESGDTYSDLPPNTYAVTVTDANGCSITIPKIDVQEPDDIEIHFSGNMPSCYGYLDGICNVNATGGTQPYTFLWSEGTLGTTISDLSTGEYYVTLTDANLCVKIDTLILPSPEQILYTENIIDASCIGNNDGEIILQIYNGSSPFTYAWNTEPVQTDSSATELIAGTYELTITDNDGCQIIQFFDVLDGTVSCLEIPTVYTPNGDGTNDDWELKGIWIYNNINIEIYNRWGDLIFNHNGTGSNYDSNRWDGTYKGKELPISSYIYIINLNNETEPIQGIVTIKK